MLRGLDNAAARALAGTWRGGELPYGLYGTAVVTGPNRGMANAKAQGAYRVVINPRDSPS